MLKKDPETIQAEYDRKCKEHPEYTDRQKECLLYSLNVRKACEVGDDRIREKRVYNEFVKEHPAMAGISEGVLRPLIREKDLVLQQKAIKLVAKAGEEKEELYGSRKKMEDLLTRNRYVEPEAEADTKDITATPFVFAEKVDEFIKWCFTQRDEEVIREVIDKAIVNNR